MIIIRLFIALNFKNEVKAQISEIINKVKSNSIQGKFVEHEHMHLTVEFLGEIQSNRLYIIKEIIDELDFNAFTFNLTKIGHFKRREGNIYWLGIEDNTTLVNINNKLRKGLVDNCFELEDREFKPHITIGRKVILTESFNTNELNDIVGKIKVDINKVDLMKSEFITGKLIHSLVYSKYLRDTMDPKL